MGKVNDQMSVMDMLETVFAVDKETEWLRGHGFTPDYNVPGNTVNHWTRTFMSKDLRTWIAVVTVYPPRHESDISWSAGRGVQWTYEGHVTEWEVSLRTFDNPRALCKSGDLFPTLGLIIPRLVECLERR